MIAQTATRVTREACGRAGAVAFPGRCVPPAGAGATRQVRQSSRAVHQVRRDRSGILYLGKPRPPWKQAVGSARRRRTKPRAGGVNSGRNAGRLRETHAEGTSAKQGDNPASLDGSGPRACVDGRSAIAQHFAVAHPAVAPTASRSGPAAAAASGGWPNTGSTPGNTYANTARDEHHAGHHRAAEATLGRAGRGLHRTGAGGSPRRCVLLVRDRELDRAVRG